MTILGIAVDSSVARELDPADRELDLKFLIELIPDTEIHDLRLTITRAQKAVARRPDAKPGGATIRSASGSHSQATIIVLATTAWAPRLSLAKRARVTTPTRRR